MPTTLTSSGITFPDGTSQTAAASGGGFTRTGFTLTQSSGNYSKPGNLGYVWVACLGGGGGGSASNTHGGGGGGGAYAAFLSDDLPSSVSYTVGSGGIGYSAPGGSQNPGGASNFFNVTANGGTRGQRSFSQSPTGTGGSGSVNGSYVAGSAGTGSGGNGGAHYYHGSPGQSAPGFGGGGGAGSIQNHPHGIRNTNGGSGGRENTYRSITGGGGGSGKGAGGGGYNSGTPWQQSYPYQPFPNNQRADGGNGMVAIVEYNSAS